MKSIETSCLCVSDKYTVDSELSLHNTSCIDAKMSWNCYLYCYIATHTVISLQLYLIHVTLPESYFHPLNLIFSILKYMLWSICFVYLYPIVNFSICWSLNLLIKFIIIREIDFALWRIILLLWQISTVWPGGALDNMLSAMRKTRVQNLNRQLAACSFCSNYNVADLFTELLECISIWNN